MPIDLALTGITGAALTAAGLSPYAAVLPALLAGCAGKYIWKFRMQINVHFARQVRSFIENGKSKQILLPAIVYPALFAAAVCIPVSTAVILLCDFLVDNVQHFSVMNEMLAAASGLLLAGGLAAALCAVGFGKTFPRRTAQKYPGNTYTEKDYPEMDPDETDSDTVDPDEDIAGDFFPDPDEENMIAADPEQAAVLPDPDPVEEEAADRTNPGVKTGEEKHLRLLSLPALTEAGLLWLLFLHICYNNEWMMGQAMAVVFLPLARELRPGDRDGQREILLRQSCYFNTHCECGACIPGLMASMEEQMVPKADESSEKIDEILMVRTSLMGVCGALGDTLFQKHLIPLLLIAACLLTAVRPQQTTGPVLFTLLMTGVSFVIGLRSFFSGYHSEPLQLLRNLEKNIFRKAESGMRILLALFSIPAAFLFIRFPFKGIPALPFDMAGSSTEQSLQSNIWFFPAGAAALLLIAACMICVRRFHWKKIRLYSVLTVAGAALYIICR